MILGAHVILSTYGFWLPNDPRGSWSEFVGSWRLLQFGRATKVDTHRSVAAAPHDVSARLAAKKVLKYPPVVLSGLQARAIGRGFANYAAKTGIPVWACSILPDHTHLVLGRHDGSIEQAANFLKGESSRQLIAEGLHPLAAYRTPAGSYPKVWARGHWKVFLDSVADVERAIQYVENNPIKEGKPRQRWSFVTAFAP